MTKKYYLIIALLGWFAISAFQLLQEGEFSDFNSSETKHIEKAEKKIAKGDAIVKKADALKDEIKQLENAEGRIRMGKIGRLEQKANRIIIKSASQYKDGYKLKYKTLLKALGRFEKQGAVPSDGIELKRKAAQQYKLGRKYRRKSANLADVNKGVEYLLKANKIEGDAIKMIFSALNYIDNPKGNETPLNQETVIDSSQIETPVVIPADTIIDIPHDTSMVSILIDSVSTQINTDTLQSANDDTLQAVVSDTLVVAPVATDTIKSIEINTQDKKELTMYYSIQFLAEKSPVPKERITSMYSGPYEVVKNEAQGWFRYSIGKFATYKEAEQVLKNLTVKGYIVAYKDGVRISTREAREITNE